MVLGFVWYFLSKTYQRIIQPIEDMALIEIVLNLYGTRRPDLGLVWFCFNLHWVLKFKSIFSRALYVIYKVMYITVSEELLWLSHRVSKTLNS